MKIDVSPIREQNLHGYRLTNALGKWVDVLRAYNDEWILTYFTANKPETHARYTYAGAMKKARRLLRTFKCSQCHEVKPVLTDGGTGYAVTAQKRKVCYACCADNDRQTLRTEAKIVLYVVKRDDGYHVTNWPGSLDIKVNGSTLGSHNIARTRLDVWFSFEGTQWHGVNIGDNDILRCRKLKA